MEPGPLLSRASMVPCGSLVGAYISSANCTKREGKGNYQVSGMEPTTVGAQCVQICSLHHLDEESNILLPSLLATYIRAAVDQSSDMSARFNH